MFDQFAPVTTVFAHEMGVIIAAERVEIAQNANLLIVGQRGIELGQNFTAHFFGQEFQWLFVHGAGYFCSIFEDPGIGVHDPFGGAGIEFQALFEQASDCGFGGAHWAVQQNHALFGAVAACGGFEHLHEFHQVDVQAKNRVATVAVGIVKKFIAGDFFLVFGVFFAAKGHHHVVDTLKGGAGHFGVFGYDIEVLFVAAFPPEFLKFFGIL